MTEHFLPLITSDASDKAQDTASALRSLPHTESPDNATHIIPIGGDGFMLATLRRFGKYQLPFYGLNHGRVGFLHNAACPPDALREQVLCAKHFTITPLLVQAFTSQNPSSPSSYLAFNEISLWRATCQIAHIQVIINQHSRINSLHADGIILSTPAGSTAYNSSAGGPILPLESQLLALTPVCPHSPRHWKGALLPKNAHTSLIVKEPQRRPVTLAADNVEINNVIRADIALSPAHSLQVLFHGASPLDERIIKEQFHLSY